MTKENYAKNLNLEKKVLKELQNNCRLNLDEIGRKCGCSRYKVRRIMKKYEDNNTIVGYKAIINPKKINLKHYFILIKRTNIPLEKDVIKKIPVQNIRDFFPGFNFNITLENSYYLHGDYDMIMSFTTDDISNAKSYCNHILRVYPKYVSDVKLMETVFPFRLEGFRINLDKPFPEI